MSEPDWAPSLADVGAYAASRTAPPGEGQDNTFTAETYPTAGQVTSILSNVCSWVLAKVGTVDPARHELAATAVSMRTAGLVLVAFPVRDGDVSNGTELLKQADAALSALVGAQENSVGALSPRGSFPAAPAPIYDWAEPERWRRW